MSARPRLLVLAAALATAAGCDNSACRGVDGTCVSLTVSGSGSVDGVEVTLSGAASGVKVAPRTATQASLPVEIGLELAHASNGTLHIDAVGFLLGDNVGSGSTDVAITVGAHTSAHVTLSSGGGGADAGVDGATGPPIAVSGTRVRHYMLADGGVVDTPTDFTKNEIDALVDTGVSGFTTVKASGDATGHFSVQTPASPYYLRYFGSAIYGSAMNPDLGVWILGRPDQKHAVASTKLSFNVSSLAPWNASDTLEFFSMNAGTALFSIEGVLKPGTGVTTLGGTLDLRLAPYGMLIDAAKGDDAMLLQLVNTTGAAVAYQRLTKLASFPPFTINDGGSQTLSAAMTDVAASSSLSINWSRSQFAAAAAGINPGATDDYDLFDVFAQPGGLEHGAFSSTPDLIIAAPPSSATDVQMTFSYGNPFPTSWPLVAAVGTNHAVSYTAPNATATSFDGTIYRYAAVDQLPSPIVPLVGPVQRPLVDGQSGFTKLAGVGTTPLLSWSAPALGTPSSYAVYMYAIDEAFGATALDFMSALYTTATTVRVPPGLLVGGQSYFFELRAFADALDLSVTPFAGTLPTGWADTLTGAVSVAGPKAADGASCAAILAAHPGSPDGVYTVDGGGGTPFTTFCDMTTDGGGWTLVGKIGGRGTTSSEWLIAPVNPAQLVDPTIADGMIACANAVPLAVNAASEIRLANSARDKWVKWKLPSGRTTATLWHHAAGQATISAATQSTVGVTSSTGVNVTCYQNIYGINPFTAHGGGYPAATQNAAGNTTPGDWCMSVGTVAPNTTVDGFSQNGNGWDAPTAESDWPNAQYNVPAHLSVWLR